MIAAPTLQGIGKAHKVSLASLPSGPVLAALGVAFLVTIGLVNSPLTQQLLRFAPLGWRAQVSIEACSILYLIVADLLRGGFDSYMAAQHRAQMGRGHARRRPGRNWPVS